VTRTIRRCAPALSAATLALLAAVPSGAQEPTAHSPRDGKNAPKTLEITTIEGQILFPKVLFIAAEEPARYPETMHRIYWGTALDLGRTTRLPKHVVIGAITRPAAGNAPSPTAAPLDEPEPATPSPNPEEVNP
jgi:hypothetical protein